MSEQICPRCSCPIPIDSSAPDSVVQCPRCLLRPPWDKPHPVAITLGPGQSFIPPTIEELAGHIVGYDVQAIIGQGGMGAVYLGRQQSLDRPVAIKILPPQIAERIGFRERFAQEGRALAKLNHPNIVSVYDFGQAGPYAMLVMELVEGANLREVLAQGRLSPTEALEIIPQLCEALSYAHEEGVVHRDIKPENLLFDARGRLKITDFGLAKLLATKSTTEPESAETDPTTRAPDPTQGVVGTVHYMAPEQLENPKSVDNRADIYAMGVVFYEMLTGELPIGRFEPPSQLVGHTAVRGQPSVSIDVRLDQVVLRALEKHPEKRYGSASALMHDIDEIEKHPFASVTAKILPEGHRQRVRDTVHRAGEAASHFASASMEATEGFVSSARKTWLSDPRVELPAYWSAGVLALGFLAGVFFLNVAPHDEEVGFFFLFLSAIVSFTLARISLRRELAESDHEPNTVSRVVLGLLYLVIAAPLVIAPIAASFGLWIEIYDFPRDPGQKGWIRDWVQAIAVTTIVTSLAWLLALGLHTLFPKVFSTIFRPFVSQTSHRAAIALSIVFVGLIAGGFFALRQMPYNSYTPGVAVPQEDWDKLSPRDFKDMQYELQRADPKAQVPPYGIQF